MKYDIQFLSQTDSTNARLRELLSLGNLKEFSVLYTDYQVAGRGQRGNSWESENGKNLLFSIYLAPQFVPVKSQFLISQIASLSVAEALAQYTANITIKWPNDIYWNQKKICGMLIEHNLTNQMLSQSIIGIGLNVNQKTFLSNAPNPVSLSNIIGRDVNREALLEDILKRLNEYYEQLKSGNKNLVIDNYHRSLFRNEGYHLYSDKDGSFFAKIIRVELDGRFVLSTLSGELRSYLFKEVQVVLS